MSKHVVLLPGGQGILTIEANQWVVLPAAGESRLSWLLEQAVTQKLTHVWIVRSSEVGVLPDQAFYDEAQSAWSTICTWKYRPDFPLPADMVNELVQVVGFRKGTGKREARVNICFAQNSKWSWGSDPRLNPKELLRIVGYLEQALGVVVGSGPSGVGSRLIEQVLEKYPAWLEVPQVDWSALPFGMSAAKNLIWERKPSAEDLQKKKLVKIDKNSAYPRACVEEMFGCGAPQHVEGSAYNHRWPGAWRITLKYNPRLDLPDPLWKGATWVAAPIVKMLKYMQCEIEIHEGWVWGEETGPDGKAVKRYHGVLKSWAELLWEARKGFLDETKWRHAYAREMARDAVKDILNQTIGLTRFEGFEAPAYQRRPDWNMMVVASARAAMMYNIMKFEKEGHGLPVMIYIDALLYCADEENPFGDNRTSLGGYKHEWTLDMTDEVRDILCSSLPRAKKLERLNALAEMEGGER